VHHFIENLVVVYFFGLREANPPLYSRRHHSCSAQLKSSPLGDMSPYLATQMSVPRYLLHIMRPTETRFTAIQADQQGAFLKTVNYNDVGRWGHQLSFTGLNVVQ